MEDIRWKQRFSNFQKALSQLKKFIDKGELNELEDKTPQKTDLLGFCFNSGIGTGVDENKAFELYTQAHNAGYAVATNNLADCYERGRSLCNTNCYC